MKSTFFARASLKYALLTLNISHKQQLLASFQFKTSDKVNTGANELMLCDRAENIVGNRENAGYQCFLHFSYNLQSLPESWNLVINLRKGYIVQLRFDHFCPRR